MTTRVRYLEGIFVEVEEGFSRFAEHLRKGNKIFFATRRFARARPLRHDRIAIIQPDRIRALRGLSRWPLSSLP
jgi:hypothetical protein